MKSPRFSPHRHRPRHFRELPELLSGKRATLRPYPRPCQRQTDSPQAGIRNRARPDLRAGRCAGDGADGSGEEKGREICEKIVLRHIFSFMKMSRLRFMPVQLFRNLCQRSNHENLFHLARLVPPRLCWPRRRSPPQPQRGARLTPPSDADRDCRCNAAAGIDGQTKVKRVGGEDAFHSGGEDRSA